MTDAARRSYVWDGRDPLREAADKALSLTRSMVAARRFLERMAKP